MNVLLLHNRYRQRGGEERAVSEQASVLRAYGHRVRVLERSSTELTGLGGRARAARALLRGGEDEAEVARAVLRMGADVVHAHNLHPLFGARSLAAARGTGAATVLQLHNFRLFCAIGVAYRDGSVCHRCRGRDTRPGLRLRCRGGVAESAVYAGALARQQPLILAATDRFLALSEAMRVQLGALGLPLERTDVIANALPEDAFSRSSSADDGRYALCVGRLVEEKGFDVAVRAARGAGVPLRIVGRGPAEDRLRALGAGADVELLGQLAGTQLERVRRGAAVLLCPSRCEEQSPYSVLEAMAAGVPVMTSPLGGLPELAGQSATLPVEDVPGWEARLGQLWADRADRRRLGEVARERAWERSRPEAVHAGLISAYRRAAGEGGDGGDGGEGGEGQGPIAVGSRLDRDRT